MEADTKYQKLATEYSKLRGQASVLKRALLDEQNKNVCLRETIRIKDTSLRKIEQEVDSLGFRNKQLEQRVALLQETIEAEVKKKKSKFKLADSVDGDNAALIAEELQKKIEENAQLATLLSDKTLENQHLIGRIEEMQNMQSGHTPVKTETILNQAIQRLEETTIQCDDGSSLKSTATLDDSNTQYESRENKIPSLEREINYWRTQFEIVNLKSDVNSLTSNSSETKGDDTYHQTKEKFLYDQIQNLIEKFLYEKSQALSETASYMTECEYLQKSIQIIKRDLVRAEQNLNDSQRKYQMSEDHLKTTQSNYEAQISVLTEGVLSLSDQLAALK